MMMHHYDVTSFEMSEIAWDNAFLDKARVVSATQWQSQDISGNSAMTPHELQNVVIEWRIPRHITELMVALKPSLPWAEDHFQERVSGFALNPAPSEAWWPFAQEGNKSHKRGITFSHTYPERFWPKQAGRLDPDPHPANGVRTGPMRGIRYEYGDLQDVIALLQKDPTTRQAYLPIWFPEDTGSVEGQRVPCTLGYHFMVRREQLTITYYMRSCDYIRHFKDDVYMAARLAQYVGEQIGVQNFNLVMYIASFHIFEGDIQMLKLRRNRK